MQGRLTFPPPIHHRLGSLAFRARAESDVEAFLDYFHNSAPSRFEAIGIDMKRFPSREENRERMLKACNLDSPTVVSITLDAEIIGHSSLNPLNPGADAGIHFQIWRENLERQGLAQALVLPLLTFWFRLYSLQSIYADASADHTAINAMMHRFSIPSLGTHIAPSSTFLKERLVHRYQVTRRWLEDRGGLNPEM